MPYYAFWVDIKCENCGKMVKSIDSRYVATCAKEDRVQMPFVQIGDANGIDKSWSIRPVEVGLHTVFLNKVISYLHS
jgi:hypothetical protein